jgi:hypothetical protein
LDSQGGLRFDLVPFEMDDSAPYNGCMSQTFVPLISSGVAGPLGVLHLPRLWQKVSLEAKSQLCAGYPDIGAGFDSMVLRALNLDAEAVRKFIKETRPTYPQFESWVKQRPGVKIDGATIDASNAAIRGYHHTDEDRKGILGANGLPDEPSAPHDAVGLNNLEDWLEFHSRELA